MTKDSDIFKTARDRAYKAYDRGRHKTALRLFIELAESGDITAQLELVDMYRKGEGYAPNPGLAAHWLERITNQADEGSLEAQCALHKYYRWSDDGITPRDIHAANYWLVAAATSGSAEAQYDLAENYRFGGDGFDKDSEKSDYWLDKAVGQRYPDALVLKSFSFFEDGLPTEKAYELLDAAVKLGSVWASEYLHRYRN